MPLIECPECKHTVSNQAMVCPQCGFPFVHVSADTKAEPPGAWIIKKTPYRGIGVLMELIGVIVCFVRYPRGILIGILLLLLGAVTARVAKFQCSKCGNPLSSGVVKVCPSCGSSITLK